MELIGSFAGSLSKASACTWPADYVCVCVCVCGGGGGGGGGVVGELLGWIICQGQCWHMAGQFCQNGMVTTIRNPSSMKEVCSNDTPVAAAAAAGALQDLQAEP